MHNPAHPGEVLREHIGQMPVSKVAAHLGVSRVTLSRLLNGNSGVSAEMAIRLEKAGWGGAESWLRNQLSFDLWQARRRAIQQPAAVARPVG